MWRLVCRLAYFMTSHTWQHRTHCYNSARNDSHTFSHQKSEVSPFTWFVHPVNDTSGEGCPTRKQEGNWMSWIKMGGWEEREAKIENSAACTWQADKALSRLESHLLFMAACVIRRPSPATEIFAMLPSDFTRLKSIFQLIWWYVLYVQNNFGQDEI